MQTKNQSLRNLGEHEQQAAAAIRKKQVLVAEKLTENALGKPAGFVWFETARKTPFGVNYGSWRNEFAWISWVYVETRYRGKGVGQALYAEVERVCRKRGIREILLDVFAVNEKSRAFHRKLGFAPLLSIYSKKME